MMIALIVIAVWIVCGYLGYRLMIAAWLYLFPLTTANRRRFRVFGIFGVSALVSGSIVWLMYRKRTPTNFVPSGQKVAIWPKSMR